MKHFTIDLDNNITVTVTRVSGNKVRLAFTAPDNVRILRGELACWLPQAGQRPAKDPCSEQGIPELLDGAPAPKPR